MRIQAGKSRPLSVTKLKKGICDKSHNSDFVSLFSK